MSEILHHGSLLADELGNLCGTHTFGMRKEREEGASGVWTVLAVCIPCDAREGARKCRHEGVRRACRGAHVMLRSLPCRTA